MTIRLLLLLSFISFLFFSCSDDDTPSGSSGSTISSIQLVITDTTVYQNDTLDGGSSFNVLFTASKGNADLESWSLTLDNNPIAKYSNIPVSNPTNFTEEIKDIEVPLSSGKYSYAISIKDINGVSVEESWTISVLETFNPPDATASLLVSDSTVYSDTTLAVGTVFDILISAEKGFYKMESWSIKRDGISFAAFDAIDVPDDSVFTLPITDISVPLNEGVYSYSFELMDEKGGIVEINWLITAADIPTFTEYTNIQLGAQASPNFGAFFLVRQVEVSTLSEANASNGEAVEFFYYNEATNGPTFFSPNDPDAGSLYGGSVASWFIRFDTQLQRTTLDYNTVTAQVIDESLVSGTKVSQLVLGDVVLVETPLGDKAILIIRTLNSGNAGNIEFDIKIVE